MTEQGESRANRVLRKPLRTPRLVLRRPSVADIDAIYAIYSDARACEHNPADVLGTRRDAAELLRRWDTHWSEKGYGYFSMDLPGTDAPIGFCGIKLVRFRGERVLNLFYRLDPAFWGQGFATEAARAVVDYTDRRLPELAMIAKVRPQNVASRRIVTKLGLVKQPSLGEVGEDGWEDVYTRRWPTTDNRAESGPQKR
jgi:ribosomal-protein-alanine N-acetyltransferase